MTALKLPPPVVVRSVAAQRSPRAFATTLLEADIPHPQAPAPPPRESASASPKGSESPTREAVQPAPVNTPPAPGGPARQVDSALFRHEALRAYKLGFRLSTPLTVVPLSTRLLLLTLAGALLATLLVACLGQVDLTARGRGVIRTREGVQPLMLEIDGVVRELRVHDGDVVQAGQVLLRLDSTRLSAALHESEEQLFATRERNQKDDADALRGYLRDRVLLERRAHLTHARIASQERSVGALDRDRGRYVALARDGLVAERQLRDSEKVLHQERRGLLTLQDELARIEQQSTALEQTHRAASTLRAHELRDAVSKRDAALALLQQTELKATREGRIESLSVAEGDVVATNRVLARLVPLSTGRRVTAFVPERDRAFVRRGALVRLELDQLPVGEFGSAAARVVRVSSEVASQPEIERTLGAAAPEGVHFAIALELLDDEKTRALTRRVGSGTLLTVRMPVRRRRIIALLFDPVRKWLD